MCCCTTAAVAGQKRAWVSATISPLHTICPHVEVTSPSLQNQSQAPRLASNQILGNKESEGDPTSLLAALYREVLHCGCSQQDQAEGGEQAPLSVLLSQEQPNPERQMKWNIIAASKLPCHLTLSVNCDAKEVWLERPGSSSWLSLMQM